MQSKSNRNFFLPRIFPVTTIALTRGETAAAHLASMYLKNLTLKTARQTLTAIAVIVGASLSCDSSTGPGGDGSTAASLQLSTVAASQASIIANGSSTAQITVSLKDDNGAALGKSGGVVTVSATRGTVGPVTDQNNGTYTATLTSSTTAGAAVVSASLGGSALSNTATVTFVPGPAAAITVANAASNGQTAVVGAAVANPPSVKVADANGNGVPNLSVTFAVASGGGSVTGGSQTTSESGVATVGSWRLGNTTGANTLTATVSVPPSIVDAAAGAMADLVITFTATAIAGSPGSITSNGGDGQTAVAGTAVTTPPSVKVLDANGNPVTGASVNFVVSAGGGSLTGASTATNASGIATLGSWTLGNTAGSNAVTAGAIGVTGSVTFSATGIPGPAASIAIANAASNGQSAPAGSAVSIPPSVKVTDSRGNGVSGVAVIFAVATGGGSITGANATTDASGVAAVGSWTLGSAAGQNSLTATAGSLTGSPLTITATGTAGSAGSLSIVAGNAQTAIAGTNVSTPPSVRVTDSNGNVVAGATVTFAVASGGGSITGATATSNASGIATVGSWKLGTTAGTNTLTASSGSLPSVTFTATGTAGAAALITINAGNNQSAGIGTPVSIPPSVKVTDANSNPVTGAPVTFAVTGGGGSVNGANATTDANGIATVGSWTLGPAAGANTLAASLNGVTGATVTFNATASAVATLTITVTGSRERSQTVTVSVSQDGTPLAPSSVTLTVVPADGGQVNPDGTIKLLKTGSLAINATTSTRSGSTSITVTQPPLIVFDLMRNFSRQVWQVAIDGGDLKQLTKTGSDNQHPSRVGNRLVYAGARNGNAFDLFAMNLVDSTETQLTNTALAERDPNLSPNGSRIVFVTPANGLDRAMYSNADGTGSAVVNDISNNTGAIEISPAWSPTSDQVVLSSTATGGSPDLWIQSSFGTIATKLPAPANTTFPELNPVWNAAGQIAFHTTRSGPDEIWVTNTSGSTATKVTEGAAPTWLIDGRIVFVRFSGSSGSLFWVDPANPSVVHPIDVGGGDAQRPSAVLP